MEEDIEKQAQEIYDRILREIKRSLESSLLSETDLGNSCGLSQATINRIKSGARGSNLPFISILKLALALNIDLSTLCFSTGSTRHEA